MSHLAMILEAIVSMRSCRKPRTSDVGHLCADHILQMLLLANNLGDPPLASFFVGLDAAAAEFLNCLE